MKIEKWIKENSELVDNCFSGERLIHPESIKELLKTHAIVSREPNQKTQEVIMINRSSNKHSVDFYGEIIKAAEEE